MVLEARRRGKEPPLFYRKATRSETPRGRATGHQKTKNQKLTVGYDDTQYNAL